MEVLLMVTAVCTALIQYLITDSFSAYIAYTVVGGWLSVACLLHKATENKSDKFNIWDGVIRAIPGDKLCNCVCCLLIPVAVLLSTLTRTKYEPISEYTAYVQSLVLSLGIAAGMVTWHMMDDSSHSIQSHDSHRRPRQSPRGSTVRVDEKRKEAASQALRMTAPVLLGLLIVNNQIFGLGVLPSAVQLLCIGIQLVLQTNLPLWSPMNFTFGEVAIISQGASLFLGCALCDILHKFGLMFQVGVESSYIISDTNLYMEVAVLCCVLIVTAAFVFPCCRTAVGFYMMFAAVMCGVALPLIYILLGQNLISWTLLYVTERPLKKRLFIYWAECCIVGALIVVTVSGTLSHLIRVTISFIKSRLRGKFGVVTTESREMVAVSGSSPWIRKLFHLLAVAIFLPGAMREPEMTCVAGTCCLIVFLIMETMRLCRVAPLYWPLQQTFTVFLDEKDQGPLILTHVYLLVGCVLPLWLYPLHLAPRHIALHAGVMSLGVGDTAAAIVGSAVGKHFWSGSRRTKEGTLAAITAQAIIVFLLISQNAFESAVDWGRVVIAIFMTSLVEAHTSHIDNLILPLVMYILLV